MQYRTIGTSGIRVSEVSVAATGTGLLADGDPEEQRRALERAIDLGVNYVEVEADANGRSSRSGLGKTLKALGVRPVLALNVEIGAQDRSDIPGALERVVDRNLKALGIEYLDVVNVVNGPVERQPEQRRAANILLTEEYVQPDGVAAGLTRLVQAGKARIAGLAARGGDAAEVHRLIDTGAFHLLNVVYNLVNPSAAMASPRGLNVDPDFGGIVRRAQERGLGVVVHDPLAGGVLADPVGPDGGKPPRRTGAATKGRRTARQQRAASDAATRFRFLSERAGSLAGAATAFALMDPAVTTVLAGSSEIGQLEAMAAASGADPLDEQTLIRIEMAWRASQGG